MAKLHLETNFTASLPRPAGDEEADTHCAGLFAPSRRYAERHLIHVLITIIRICDDISIVYAMYEWPVNIFFNLSIDSLLPSFEYRLAVECSTGEQVC